MFRALRDLHLLWAYLHSCPSLKTEVKQCFPYLRVRSGFGYTLCRYIFAFLYGTVCSSLISALMPSGKSDRKSDITGNHPQKKPQRKWWRAFKVMDKPEHRRQEYFAVTTVSVVIVLCLPPTFWLDGDMSDNNMLSHHCTRAARCGFFSSSCGFVRESGIVIELFKCETSRNEGWWEQHSFISWSRLRRMNWF